MHKSINNHKISLKQSILLFVTSFLLFMVSFSGICKAEAAFSGKWILFGENNKYMISCPASMFDQMDDESVYGLVDYGVYFAVNLDDQYIITAMDMDIIPEYREDLTGKSFDDITGYFDANDIPWTQEEQYGISFIRGVWVEALGAGISSISEERYILNEGEGECLVKGFLTYRDEDYDTAVSWLDTVFSTIQPVQGSSEAIGQYGMYKIVETLDGEDVDITNAQDVVLTLAEEGLGYLWLVSEGGAVTEWNITDNKLSLRAGADQLEGTYENGEIVLNLNDIKIYLRKSSENLMHPFNETE